MKLDGKGEEALYLCSRPVDFSFLTDRLARVLVARMTAGGTFLWEQATGLQSRYFPGSDGL